MAAGVPFALLVYLRDQARQAFSSAHAVVQLQLSQHGAALAGLHLPLQLSSTLPLSVQSSLGLCQLALQQLQLQLTAAILSYAKMLLHACGTQLRGRFDGWKGM